MIISWLHENQGNKHCVLYYYITVNGTIEYSTNNTNNIAITMVLIIHLLLFLLILLKEKGLHH